MQGYSATPADLGLTFDDLSLETTDGLSIAAWYVPNTKPQGNVFFCHSNAGNIADRLVTIKALHLRGHHVLIFDYRGYGRSEGKPDEAGNYEDAETAWRYLVETRGERPDRIVLIGRSLGGAVAIELATRHAPTPSYILFLHALGGETRYQAFFLPTKILLTIFHSPPILKSER
ncbi:MAG: alpha/beta fold hydrolase [Proteobacteria bacterium]|nr:alpha/beta fold hydrolase [Pseudomonadota bacterium]